MGPRQGHPHHNRNYSTEANTEVDPTVGIKKKSFTNLEAAALRVAKATIGVTEATKVTVGTTTLKGRTNSSLSKKDQTVTGMILSGNYIGNEF